MAASPFTPHCGSLRVGNGNLEIFYQNVRGLRTKSTEIFNTVCSFDYEIICLTETWLNESFSTQDFFPGTYTVYRSDRDCIDKLRGGGVLTAVSDTVFGIKRRPDLEFFHESVWVEATLSDGRNLLIGNHYFAPDIKVDIINNYFNFLENSLDTLNYRVLLLGDFNVPGYDWDNGFPSPTSHFYTKLRGDVIYSAVCYLGFSQYNHPVNGLNLLDLVFSNFGNFSLISVDQGLVHPDPFHPPFIIDCKIPLRQSNQNFSTPCKLYSAGDYALLYNALFTYDWSALYNETSVDAAVDQLNIAVMQAINLAVPSGWVKKRKYPIWFSGRLIAYVKRKNYFYRRYKKHKTDRLYDRFSFYRKLVKRTIKSDKHLWLLSVDQNLKSNPQQFWKYVSQHRKKYNDLTYLDDDGVLLNEPHDIVESFSKHFQSVFNRSTLGIDTLSLDKLCTDNLPLAYISNRDVQNAIKRLRPTKSVGTDGIPNFVIKGCSEILVPVLRYIFNLSLSQNSFPKLWKQAIIVPVFKKGKTSSVRNYRPIAILNNFSKVFEFIIHDHIYQFFKSKLSPFQHGFIKSKSTTTNLVTFLDFVSPLVCTQGQVDSIYFDFSNAFDTVSHTLLLYKLNNYGLSSGYVNWLRSYLTDRESCVRFLGLFSTPFIVLSGVPQGSVLGPLLFNIFINDLPEVINHSSCLLFADDFKVYRAIKTLNDCLFLQSDIERVQDWCSVNLMKPNLSKTNVISFSRKTTVLKYQYRLGNFFILRTDSIKDLGVLIDSKLHFHQHVDILFSQTMKLLGLIRTITFSFSTLDSLLMLYTALIRSKLEYASVVWNSITNTDSSKLERIQRKFAALCHNRFFKDIDYHYFSILDKLNLQTLDVRRRHIDALFLINVFRGTTYCSSVLDAVGLRVPSRNIRNFSTFSCSFSRCPTARCVVAANFVCELVDIFSKSSLSLNCLV
ncbi:hypothetical protein B7P43_G14658 [Cryptotermes secundus]|uniref:Reverse transcriptase domain-containing protein n=1 Tax=Cryptotermes secundus TaxID=105785 RepID=A0A2J7PTY4_9NEOP|nr:hypothetical protein B7P43_G14658 [Cryptotermes secundus]